MEWPSTIWIVTLYQCLYQVNIHKYFWHNHLAQIPNPMVENKDFLHSILVKEPEKFITIPIRNLNISIKYKWIFEGMIIHRFCIGRTKYDVHPLFYKWTRAFVCDVDSSIWTCAINSPSFWPISSNYFNKLWMLCAIKSIKITLQLKFLSLKTQAIMQLVMKISMLFRIYLSLHQEHGINEI